MVGTWCFLCQKAACQHTREIEVTHFDHVRNGHVAYVASAEYIWDGPTDTELLEERVASRRIVPPNRAQRLKPALLESVFIRWMAKALIGGQK